MSNRRDYGSGSISFHSDSKLFQGRVYITTAGGKRIRKSIYARTRREAQRKLTELQAQVQNGSYVKQSDISLSLWLQEWFEKYKRAKLKPNTESTYTMLINTLINPYIGNVILKDLSPLRLQEYFNTLSPKYSPSTLLKIKNLLNPALRAAVENDMLSKSPMAGVTLPKPIKPSVRALSAAEITKLCEAAKGYRLYYAILLALETGLRIGELLALTWGDFSASQKSLTINKTLIEVKDKDGKTVRHVQHSPKTESSNRVVPLSVGAMEILADHARETGACIKDDKDKLIFCTKAGSPYEYRNFNRTLAAICQKAGITRVSAHGLRHSFASVLNQRGADLKAISEILGHAKTTTTINTYVHTSSDMKEEAVNLMDIYQRSDD